MVGVTNIGGNRIGKGEGAEERPGMVPKNLTVAMIVPRQWALLADIV